MNNANNNTVTDTNLNEILTQAIEQMKEESNKDFSLEAINLAELSRRTGLTRSKLRTLKKKGFIIGPPANKGSYKDNTVMSGFSNYVDDLLRKNVSNSEVIFSRIRSYGYTGSRSTLKRYIAKHKDLIPPARQVVVPQGNRGRRWTSGPGESYQMDWGFVNIRRSDGITYQVACFALICHHCGTFYIEFFPNAKQESLFIGMIHAFLCMGVPKYILTDNMKSVVIRRDALGYPIWQKDYESFMKSVGFMTKLCKPRHPFTKGKVERLVRFVKDNFIAGRTFSNITDLNIEALNWCSEQNGRYHRSLDCTPIKRHSSSCSLFALPLVMSKDIAYYLHPLRKISFDGFISYEGNRFGVPFSYGEKECRVIRTQFELEIWDSKLTRILTKHNVTWSRKDTFCNDQFSIPYQPEELPSTPVKVSMREEKSYVIDAFDMFDFEMRDDFDE